MQGIRMKKDQQFKISEWIKWSLWIIIFVYGSLALKYENIPLVIVACMLIGLGTFLLLRALYFKKTVGGYGILAGKSNYLFWGVFQFLVCLLIGLVILFRYYYINDKVLIYFGTLFIIIISVAIALIQHYKKK